MTSPQSGQAFPRTLILGSAALTLCLVLQVWLALKMEINWDEFFFLSHVYDFQRGDMTKALQSLHVHLLGWLTGLPGNEIDQIVLGRLFMLFCASITCVVIYRLSRLIADPLPSLLAVVGFASAGFTILHGASFRADPLAGALVMLSLMAFVQARADAVGAVLVAVPAAVGAMITVKVGLYAPAFAAVALWRYLQADDRKALLRWLVLVLGAVVIAFAALYAWQLSLVPSATNAGSGTTLSNAAGVTLLGGLLPRGEQIVRAMLVSPMQSILIIAGAIGLMIRARSVRDSDRRRLLLALGLASPLLCLLFYRNAFAYFFPFIMPPAMVLAAWAMQNLPAFDARRRYGVLTFAFVLPALLITMHWSQRGQAAQREVIEAVHLAFPQPVPVIDRNSMIASYPKRGIFMSTWGMMNYRNGEPVFADIMAEDVVPVLVLNHSSLQAAVGAIGPQPGYVPLFREDAAILRNNFIEHWGSVWVAGKRFAPADEDQQFEVLIPGTYTVEGAPLLLDGTRYDQGAQVSLPRGSHVARTIGAEEAVLRWGSKLKRPEGEPSTAPLYHGFWF